MSKKRKAYQRNDSSSNNDSLWRKLILAFFIILVAGTIILVVGIMVSAILPSSPNSASSNRASSNRASYTRPTSRPTSRPRPTPRPRPTQTAAQKIRAAINRTNVEVFKVTVSGNDATIEYDLIPQFIQPNEWIHDRQMYKMVCALKPAKHTITFVGMGRFKDAYGDRVSKPSVETQISAEAMNRINCGSDTSAHDIAWKGISEYYKSYPIPRGLSVDD